MEYSCITYDRIEGNYDLFCQSNTQAKYIIAFNSFEGKAKKFGFEDKTISFLVEEDYDFYYNFPIQSIESLLSSLTEYFDKEQPDRMSISKIERFSRLLDEIGEENEKLTYEDLIKKCDNEIKKSQEAKAKLQNQLEKTK